MTENSRILRIRERLASAILVCMMVASFAVILLPMQAPPAAALVHLSSTSMEDNNVLYDTDMTPFVVRWQTGVYHELTGDYMIEPGFELQIPADPSFGVNVTGHFMIDVQGTLRTYNDGNFMTRTPFRGTNIAQPTNGIYFRPGSSGNIVDLDIIRCVNGVVFEPGSTMLSPGVQDAAFREIFTYGLRMDSVVGATNVMGSPGAVLFDDNPTPSAVRLMEVKNCMVNISRTSFSSHAANYPQLFVDNATVYGDAISFINQNQVGNALVIQGAASNGSVFKGSWFESGATGYHYVKTIGTQVLFDNCSFSKTGNPRSINATNNPFDGAASNVTLLNPTADTDPGFYDYTFDNTTLNVSGSSMIILQWYKNVQVIDPDTNPIANSPVSIIDVYDNPATPPTKITDVTGWARWFKCTEFVMYPMVPRIYFNPYNISAENNSMMGYAIPEETMNASKENIITVPFNPIANNPPTVTFIQTPTGIQSGPVSIQFMLNDLDLTDNGNLSITVQFWDPTLAAWRTATLDPLSDTNNLLSDTLYTLIWVSNDVKDFANKYSTEVKIRITPHDKSGPGTASETGTFTVDNLAPNFVSGPTITHTNNSAMIQWTMDEACNASVYWGLDPTPTTTTTGSSGSPSQTVTLTGLAQGRKYIVYLISTDPAGNKWNSSSEPEPNDNYNFETDIHIELVAGWNMISLAPIITNSDPEAALASIAGQYHSVQMYDALEKEWRQYVPGKPFGNDLESISDQGIWINMKNAAVLKHNNSVPTSPSPIPNFLLKGWNLVGYTSVTTRSVSAAMGSVVYNIIQTYDAAAGKWLSWNGVTGDLTTMGLSHGYWIHVSFDQFWNITYA